MTTSAESINVDELIDGITELVRNLVREYTDAKVSEATDPIYTHLLEMTSLDEERTARIVQLTEALDAVNARVNRMAQAVGE